MALSFNDVNGSAKKSDVNYFKLEDGANRFRIVGEVLPRYLYWVRNSENKNMPFECLGFDRDKEKFTNIEHDYVQERVKVKNKDTGVMEPIKCGWAYACQVLDKDGKLSVLNLKKKMFEAIIAHAGKVGDPTDPVKGYDIYVDKVKTGAHAYNVEYRLDVVTMMTKGPRPLSEAELEVVANMKPIDELIPRPTAEEQRVQLENFLSGVSESKDEEATSNARNELDDL